MMKRMLALLIPVLWASSASAVEVSSIVSCRADGEVWLCAAWREGRVEVFRSEQYLSEVVFRDPPTASRPSPGVGQTPSLKAPDLGTAVEPRYTLQLYACSSMACMEELAGGPKIPGSRLVYIKGDDGLWQVLIAGEFNSRKAAQTAAGELMARYGLHDRPWVRSLESIRRRQVRY